MDLENSKKKERSNKNIYDRKKEYNETILKKLDNSSLESLLESISEFIKSFADSFGLYSLSLEFVSDDRNFFSYFKPNDEETWENKNLERIIVYSEIGESRYDNSIRFRNRPIRNLIDRAYNIPTVFKFLLEGKPFQIYYNKEYLSKLKEQGYINDNFIDRNKEAYYNQSKQDRVFKIRYPTFEDFLRRLTLPIFLDEPTSSEPNHDIKIYGIINIDGFYKKPKPDEPINENFVSELEEFLKHFARYWDKSLFEPESGLNQQLKSVSENILSFEKELAKIEKGSNTLIHSLNVYTLASDFVRHLALNFKEEFSALEYFSIRYGALIHDAGKIKLPKEILSKPDKLTSEEFEIIKKHPLYGFEMLKNSRIPSDSLKIIRYHHEREDGSGYPEGLVNKTISRGARIVAIVDVFEALLGKRPYPRPIDHIKEGPEKIKKALDIIELDAQKGKFYDKYVNAFRSYIESLEKELNTFDGPIDITHQEALNFYRSIRNKGIF